MGEPLLLYCVALPAIAGLVCYVVARWAGRATAVLALPAAAATFLLCCLLPGRGEREFVYPWLSVGGFDVAMALRVGPLASLGAVFVGLFGVLVAAYSLPYMWKHRYEGRYYAFMLWALSGAIGAVLADHLVFFLMAWEVVSLMLYLLVNLGREPAAKVGAKSFVLLGFADAALLLGIAMLWHLNGGATLRISELSRLPVEQTATAMGTAAFLLMFAGAIAKAGAIPLHTWIPAVSEAAPLPVMAYLPASLDKLLGISLLARVALQFFTMTAALQLVVMIVGAVTVIGAVMMAMVQHDLRRLLSFHAVSQVGYMVLGVGTGTLVGVLGGLFHMVNHAIYKCCLFLMAGSVRHRTGTAELERLGGLARAMPFTFFAGVVAALAISGVPPLNGFASKWMVYQGVLATRVPLAPALLIAAVFGSALTLASFVKVIHSVFFGRMSEDVQSLSPREAPGLMGLPMIVLAFLCLGFGVFAGTTVELWIAPALSEVNAALLAPGQAVAYDFGFWQATQATVLLLIGLALGLVLYLVGRVSKARVSRQFVGGELAGTDEYRVAGTGFYETVRQLPVLRGMFRDAEEEAYDVYHLGGRYGSTLVQALRGLHTGVLAVYVTWCVLGLAVVLLYLLPL
ncbi:MAG: NADH-quinone oxidoreductase subunit L [Candidatus Brocadiia bacterium]